MKFRVQSSCVIQKNFGRLDNGESFQGFKKRDETIKSMNH